MSFLCFLSDFMYLHIWENVFVVVLVYSIEGCEKRKLVAMRSSVHIKIECFIADKLHKYLKNVCIHPFQARIGAECFFSGLQSIETSIDLSIIVFHNLINIPIVLAAYYIIFSCIK